jgi:Ca2+-transporting ATPase
MNNWYSLSEEEIVKFYGTDTSKGLTHEQVNNMRQKYGKNEIISKAKKTITQMLIDQFKSFMIIILIIAAVVSGITGVIENEGFADSIIILIIVILNAVIGVVQEIKAQNSLDALKNLSTPHCKVIRNGNLEIIESKDLVPGDIVILDTGDYVPADLRLIETINLKIQEAALTGESVPVEKSSEVLETKDIGIGDRTNCAYSSSLVTYGRGRGIVVETGMNTEVGKIAEMIQSVDDSDTPLKRRLEELGKTLGIVAIAICLIIFIAGSLYGKNILHMFMTSVSLAVAAIPEGLPAISTIVLAIGVQRMVKRNAIVRTLPSVETLGSATVICSDKTGTLTQNKMTVEKIYYNYELYNADEKLHNVDDHLNLLIDSMIMCNDSKIKFENNKYTVTGDPTETALVDLGIKYEILKTDADDLHKRVEEIPFDSNRKLMTTVHEYEEEYMVYTKGALDELLSRCTKIYFNNQEITLTDDHVNDILQINSDLSSQALRVLAMAYKRIEMIPLKSEIDSLESNLIFIGMVGMIDPARPEAYGAVQECKEAGIKPVMITGDHKITAIAIAKDIGILSDESEAITGAELEKMSQDDLVKNVRNYSVYARVSPEHKVRIVKAWQTNGEIVAMTGDGVNDAPALKTSDIGAAMGIVGTDVAKESADIVLTDDNFATIVSAVEEGRRIYDNILKAIQFLLSSNVGEIITLFVATMFNLIEPLVPIHILWINLVTDSLPALALSVDPAESNIMKRKAKKSSNIFSKGMIWRIVYQGIMIGFLTLLAYSLGCGFNYTTMTEETLMTAQTMAFGVLALSQLVHVFNIRSNTQSIFKVKFSTNNILIGASAISSLLMFIVLEVPFLHKIFNVATLGFTNWIIVIGLSLAPLLIVEIFKLLKINTFKDENI